MRQPAVLLFGILLLFLAFLPCQSVEVNTAYLRHDETLNFDEIDFEMDGGWTSPGTGEMRALGLGLLQVRFLDARSRALFTIDVGTPPARYYLGEGWHEDETWGMVTACWANTRAPAHTLFCLIPADSRFIEIVCCSPPAAVTSAVVINGRQIGMLRLPANSGNQTYKLRLPDALPRHLYYRLKAGGRISIAGIDWLDYNGNVNASVQTPAMLNAVDETAIFPVQIPPGTGDFIVHLAAPAPEDCMLQVGVENASSTIVRIPAGTKDIVSTERDALKRQANRKTQTDGWGEDFNVRNSFRAHCSVNPDSENPVKQYPIIINDGEAVELSLPADHHNMFVELILPQALPLAQYPYLTIKIRVTQGVWYYIAPFGYEKTGKRVPLFNCDNAPYYNDDRIGTGDWETITINLLLRVNFAGTKGVSIRSVEFWLGSSQPGKAMMAFDYIRINHGLCPNIEDVETQETVYNDNLDNDVDNLVDIDDAKQEGKLQHFSRRPLVMAVSTPIWGSRLSSTGHWNAWNQAQMSFPKGCDRQGVPTGMTFDPDTYDPRFLGKRNISSTYYPLKYCQYPDYIPPVDGRYRYDLYGGVDIYDNLNREFWQKEVTLAQQYGIDGFLLACVDDNHNMVFEKQTMLAFDAALQAKQPFFYSALYDCYYGGWINDMFLPEKSAEQIVRDLLYMTNRYGGYSCWLRYNNRPVIMPCFWSDHIAVEKWSQVKSLSMNPFHPFDGLVTLPARNPGYDNRVTFTFSKAEQPANGDQRYLSVLFDSIQCLDRNLHPISMLDLGTAAARPHLLSGWSNDEDWGNGQTMVWTEGREKKAVLKIEIPPETAFLQLRCGGNFHANSISISINGGSPLTCAISIPIGDYIFRLASAGTMPPLTSTQDNYPPYALFLDSIVGPKLFDGSAYFGQWSKDHRWVVSDPTPTILTVCCGYDDHVVRVPGNKTIDRENGAFYRRNWEAVLAQDPDIVLINTWNQWDEGTNIAPSVEFGYQYVELTLTYSLMLHRKLSVSAKPSEIGLTVKRYDFDTPGAGEIRLSAEKAGQLSFHQLPISAQNPGRWQVLKDGQPYAGFAVNPREKSLTLGLQASRSTYIIRGTGLDNR